MTHRPTEYQALKRMLYFIKDVDSTFTGRDANALIGESVEAAYQNMTHDEQVSLGRQHKRLDQHARTKGKTISEYAALEVLAAIGNLDLIREKE